MSNAIRKMQKSLKYNEVQKMIEKAVADMSNTISNMEESRVDGKKVEIIYPLELGIKNKRGDVFVFVVSAYPKN
jgi:hypothetical protein